MESYLPQLLIVAGSGEADQTKEVVDFVAPLLKLSKDIVINHSDVHWLNPTGEPPTIDQVRELQTLVGYHPYQLPHSVFVLQALDTASLPAQNSLLKLLEEPPSHALIVLTASDSNRVLPTIQSRCLLHSLAPMVDLSAELDTSTIADLYHHLTQASYGELVEIAQQYPDKPTSVTLLRQLITYLHQQLQTPDSQTDPRQLTAHLQITLTALTWLDRNVNPKLALTEALLRLKRKLPILPPSKA